MLKLQQKQYLNIKNSENNIIILLSAIFTRGIDKQLVTQTAPPERRKQPDTIFAGESSEGTHTYI